MPVTPVRISWKPIAGTTTGMKTDSRGLAGRRRSVVAIRSMAGGEVRCFIDAIFGHSLGSGESRGTFT